VGSGSAIVEAARMAHADSPQRDHPGNPGTISISIRVRGGMDFISFVILLIISAVVSAILHYGLNYYVMPGFWSFCSKVVLGWVGAWLGSPIFGYWPHRFPVLQYENIWFIPAILGSLAVLLVAVDLAKMWRGAP